MKARLAAVACLVLGAALFGRQEPPPDGVEVQARGPVHEAFAEPTTSQGTASPVVPKEPPPPVEESPPEERPEGDNVGWIPGYWAWDEEASDFLWVSGVWREEPPGRDWVPGEWRRVASGYQWVSGYWAPERQPETEFLPPPPESLERGPSAPAPSADSAYLPGYWAFQETRYVWRPGHWVAHQPGWVWTAPCYKWSPAGHVFVSGFWDRPLAERGLLFAPVRFAASVASRRGFVYRPSHVVQPDFLLGSLFVRSSTRHYHFGDYFDAGLREKYVPWVDYRAGRGVADANYTYYRSSFARRGDWDRNLRGLYAARYNGDVPRPPRTLAQQTTVVNNITTNNTVNVAVNKTLNITNSQNVTALQSVKKMDRLRVTGLAALAGGRLDPTTKEVPGPARDLRVGRARAEQLEVERRQTERYRAVSQERVRMESSLIGKGAVPPGKGVPAGQPGKGAVGKAGPPGKADDIVGAPRRVRMELPKAVPPPRERIVVKAPPPPVPAVEPKGPPPGKGKGPPPKKDKDLREKDGD